MLIEVRDLRKVFKKYKRKEGLLNSIKSLFNRKFVEINAVDGLSFSIRKGELVGFLGPNGAGKSTTIKMLTGILHPTSGVVKCLGYEPFKEREKYVKNIGVIFGQKSTLWFNLPPLDSFNLSKDIYGIEEVAFKKRLNRLLDLLDIREISKTPVRRLSLGERMKCEFVNAVLHDPKILFFDEPTIGLDIVAKEKIRDFIRDLNRKGKTIILTTHDISDVEQLCNRIIIIDKGKKVYDGSLRKLKKDYIKYKRLIIELEKETKSISIPNTEVIRHEGIEVELRVDITRTSMTQVLENLFSKYKVADVNIEEQTVESIIKSIYEGK